MMCRITGGAIDIEPRYAMREEHAQPPIGTFELLKSTKKHLYRLWSFALCRNQISSVDTGTTSNMNFEAVRQGGQKILDMI